IGRISKPPPARLRILTLPARWRIYSASAVSLTLSCAAPPICQYHQVQTRRAMPQLNLNFTDIPIPETHLWEHLDDEQKRIVIETLARLLVKATGDKHQEQTNND